MTYPFDDTYRQRVATLCAAFDRLPGGSEAGHSLKRAAVAIAVIESDNRPGEAAFLLTKRTSKLRAHGGQWALPGGRCDEGETVAEAALRELDEELGLRLATDAVLGTLDDYPTRSGYLITPVVMWAARMPVCGLIRMKSPLCTGSCSRILPRSMSSVSRSFPRATGRSCAFSSTAITSMHQLRH